MPDYRNDIRRPAPEVYRQVRRPGCLSVLNIDFQTLGILAGLGTTIYFLVNKDYEKAAGAGAVTAFAISNKLNN